MTTHRFYCPNLAAGDLALDPEEARHALQVLRLAAGDTLALFDGKGRAAVGTLVRATRREAVVAVSDVPPVAPAPAPALTLLTALPRLQRQPFLFEKCTELGVSRIVPVLYQRSTVKPQPSAMAKWRRTTVEAAKQSGCTYLPRVDEPVDFAASLGMIAPDCVTLFGAVGSGASRLADLLSTQPAAIACWIGPEGGLNADETNRLQASGAKPASLGTQVLRIETAALVVAAAAALYR